MDMDLNLRILDFYTLSQVSGLILMLQYTAFAYTGKQKIGDSDSGLGKNFSL